MNDLREEILEKFAPVQTVSVATVEGDHPRVRPMSMLYLDQRFFLATGNGEEKMKQIAGNPHVEFCLTFHTESGSGYIRGAGVAEIIENLEWKDAVLETAPLFSQYFSGANDPYYALIELKIEAFEYLPAGKDQARHFRI